MAIAQDNVTLYRRFLDAMNAADYDGIDSVMAETFRDHHPGYEVNGRDDYKAALRAAREALNIRGSLDSIMAVDDRVVTMATLTGRHVGRIFDAEPTGRDVRWTTTEVWRVDRGRFVERWAQDDLLGLVKQLSSDEENCRVIRRLDDVVNSRVYDDMDELFDPGFADRNPAWSVQSLDELKEIIAAAHRALDMRSHQDEVYPAAGNRVVIHLTFTGRHVGTFLGAEPTGRPVKWTSIEIYRLENGRIAERWVQADTTGLMQQLGASLPEPAARQEG